MFDDIEIEIHCPECDMEIDVKLSQIARQERVTCRGCGNEIQLEPDAESSPE